MNINKGPTSGPTVALVVALMFVTSYTQSAPLAPAPAPQNTASASISDEIGFVMNGLIVASTLRPDINAVDTYAAAEHWSKNPPEFNALVNAKSGYHGKINGHKVILGGDGTNDIFGVTISEGFDPARVLAALRQAYTLKDEGSDDSAGQKSEAYTMSDHGRSVGMVIVTYGTAAAIQGTGTVAFMSARKVKDAQKR